MAIRYLFLLLFPAVVAAQPAYTGARVAVFGLQLIQQKGEKLHLKCKIANTGRQPVGASVPFTDTLIVEFDSTGMPALLRGQEAAIARAVREKCPALAPGAIAPAVSLTARLEIRSMEATGCAELVLDTAFVEYWDEQRMTLRYFIRNKGNKTAQLLHDGLQPVVNVYFVSGAKLTRGAVPAGRKSLEQGEETLDGWLAPGQILEGNLSIPLKDRTRFAPNIALEFDPAQVVQECSRAGNIRVITLRF